MEDNFQVFINRIGFYKTSISQLNSHFKEFIQFRIRNLPLNLTEDFKMPIQGSKLIYRNLVTLKHEITYTSFTDVGNFEQKIFEIENNYCNFCISQCFEAFETFLKDSLCTYFIMHESILNSDYEFQLLNLNLENFKACRSSIDAFLKKDNKYNMKLFKCFYQIDDEIRRYEQLNYLKFDFKKWYVVLTEVRHAITHSNSNLKKLKLSNWDNFQLELLKSIFMGTENQESITISTHNNYSLIIELIAQHAQLINDRIKLKNELLSINESKK